MSAGRDLWMMSRELEKKRVILRDLLAHRDTVDFNSVNVRLGNVYDYTWGLIMAVKKAKNEQVKKADFRGFFNFEIPSEMKAECKEWCKNEEVVGLEIEEALASNYKITLVRMEKQDAYQASMQAYNPNDVNAGLCMSAFAPHWYLAIGVLLYKHKVLLNKTWEQSEDSVPTEDFG